MSYEYSKQRAFVFTDEGQRCFLAVRDNAKALIDKSGAVTCIRLLMTGGTGGAQSTWDLLACVDRLVELGEIKEVPNPFCCAAQGRIFIGRQR